MKLLEKIRDILRWVIRTLSADFLEDISRIQQFNLSTAEMHKKAFLPYKNKFNGRDVVIVACGPTAKDYKPIPNAIHIGVNHAIRLPQVRLDYLFFLDANIARKTPGEMDEYNNYGDGKCTKFYGISGDASNPDRDWIPSESDVIKVGAIRFRTDNLVNMRITHNSRFVYDISTQPMPDFGSVVFSAIEFALWGNPNRIFLVGCDCTATGHFDSAKDKTGLPTDIRNTYTKLHAFAHTYYPGTEIISVNPVGLKGLFRDWYQSEEPCPPPRG